MQKERIKTMCFSNCPYEEWDGECRIQKKPKPHDAHCVEEENDESSEEEV